MKEFNIYKILAIPFVIGVIIIMYGLYLYGYEYELSKLGKNDFIDNGAGETKSVMANISFSDSIENKTLDKDSNANQTGVISTGEQNVKSFVLSRDTLNIDTAVNMKSYGRIECYNKNNIELDVNIIEAPEKGQIKFTGISYVYTPYPDQKGKDSFKFCVVDSYGNVSQTVEAYINIEDNVKPYYIDMIDNPYQYSSVKLASADILDGEKVGNLHFFNPTKQITGGEFIILLLATLGHEEMEYCINTGLENDSEIPVWQKPYIKKAIEIGIITEKSFSANETLTRANAILLVDRAAQIQDVDRVAMKIFDKAIIPDWALQSYINLYAYNMLELYDGSSYANMVLEKDYCGALLWQLYKYINEI